MKKSYKLFGAIWDKMPTTEDILYIDRDIFINDLDDEFNLFDSINIRKISITKILFINNEIDLYNVIDKMKKHNDILIDVDYFPRNMNVISGSFYIKIINQIYCFFKTKLKDKNVYLSSNFNDYINKIK